MKESMLLPAAWLALTNLVAFAAYGIDKLKAIRHEYRISEAALLTLSFIGGSAGALLGMLIFRHKIRKPRFVILNPLFLVIHLILAVLLLRSASSIRFL